MGTSRRGARTAFSASYVQSRLLPTQNMTTDFPGRALRSGPHGADIEPEELQREYSAEARRRWEVVKADELARKASRSRCGRLKKVDQGARKRGVDIHRHLGRHRAGDLARRTAGASGDVTDARRRLNARACSKDQRLFRVPLADADHPEKPRPVVLVVLGYHQVVGCRPA